MKTMRILMAMLLCFAMLVSMASCLGGDSASEIDYNEVDKVTVLPLDMTTWLAAAYNVNGNLLLLYETDASFQTIEREYILSRTYGDDGKLMYMDYRNGEGEMVELNFTLDENGAVTAATSEELTITYTKDGAITTETWMEGEEKLRTVAYNAESLVTRYEADFGEYGWYAASYDYGNATVSTTLNMGEEGGSLDILVNYNEKARPTSADVIHTYEGEETRYSYNCHYENERCVKAVMLGESYREEHVYTYSSDTGRRVDEKTTYETYEGTTLVSLNVMEKSYYDFLGVLAGEIFTFYKDPLTIDYKAEMTYGLASGALKTLEMTYYGSNNVISVVDTYEYGADGETVLSFTQRHYDENGTLTKTETETSTYNEEAICIKKEKLVEDGTGKDLSKTVYEYNALGGLLCYEEITYNYLFGVYVNESFVKYDANGSVIDSGTR